MQLAIVLFAVVAAVSAYPGVIDGWAAPQVHYGHAVAHPHVVVPVHHPTYVPAPVLHHPQVHAPIAHHAQYVKVAQPEPIPALHPQPLNIKVPHTQSVRLPTHPVHIPHPHLIGVEHAVHQPEPVIAKVHKSVHPIAVSAHSAHSW